MKNIFKLISIIAMVAVIVFLMTGCENNDTQTVTYKVEFNSNSGGYIAPIFVQKGETVTKPADPTRSGYDFDGWYADNNTFNHAFDFATPINSNVLLHAKWESIPWDLQAEMAAANAAISNAKQAIINAEYQKQYPQDTEYATVKTELTNYLNGLDLFGCSIKVYEGTVPHIPAVAGTPQNEDGKNGFMMFTIWISKHLGTQQRTDISITILARKFSKTPFALDTPTNITISADTLSWDSVAFAYAGYFVLVEGAGQGNEYQVANAYPATNYSFNLSILTTAGTYQVSVKAKGYEDDYYIYSSQYSTAQTYIVYSHEQATAPTVTYDLNNKIFIVTNNATGATWSDYTFIFDGSNVTAMDGTGAYTGKKVYSIAKFIDGLGVGNNNQTYSFTAILNQYKYGTIDYSGNATHAYYTFE